MFDLETLLPSTRALIERLRAIDLNYGSQQHQRDWIARMDLLQRMFPCPIDHEHTAGGKIIDRKVQYGCYTKQQDDTVAQIISQRR
jgi:hypothetical protein